MTPLSPMTAAAPRDPSSSVDPLWGEEGDVLYADLADGIFGVPGRWNVRRSARSERRLMWLDPRPTAAELPSFYRSYFTHARDPVEKHNPSIEWVYRQGVSRLPYMRERELLERMYLGAGHGRHVLEIGCGNGRRLAELRRLGWQVTGQEVDEAASDNARERFGLDLRIGDVTEIDLPAASFDAVVLHHVIEHLLDPAAVLARCRRLLKPGGELIVMTPNIDSYGHAVFGRYWFGLDPPRHLQLFSMGALQALIAEAGFARREGWTSAARAQTIGRGSVGLRAGLSPWETQNTLAKEVSALLFQWRATWRHRRDPSSGEELVVRASH